MTTTATSQVSVTGGRPWVYARLEAVAAPANIAGQYALTLIADSSCTGIPDEWRTRSYSATVTPQPDPALRPNTLFTLTAGGAALAPSHDAFQIGVSGDEAGFEIYQGEEFGLVEQVAPRTFLAFGGSAFVSGRIFRIDDRGATGRRDRILRAAIGQLEVRLPHVRCGPRVCDMSVGRTIS